MTKFAEMALRHMCRNPRCRMRLPTPVSNEREAFCARGCHTNFYLHRCRVCEEAIEQPKRGWPRLICKKSKCFKAWQANSGFGRYHGSQCLENTFRNRINMRVKLRLADDRGGEWAIAVNSRRIRAPRRVLDAVFGSVPGLKQSQAARGPIAQMETPGRRARGRDRGSVGIEHLHLRCGKSLLELLIWATAKAAIITENRTLWLAGNTKRHRRQLRQNCRRVSLI